MCRFLCVSVVYFASCTGSIGSAGGAEESGGDNAAGSPSGGTGGGAFSGAGGDDLGDNPVSAPPGPGVSTLAIGEGVGKTGMRRLTIAELDNSLRDLLGDDTRPARRLLQEENLGVFNNEYGQQITSSVLVEGFERLADDVAARLLADVGRRNTVVGCSPADPRKADGACLRKFLASFGRRALRRPLSGAEVDLFQQAVEPFAGRTSNFYAGVQAALRALLQHPEFLYRVELGTPVAGHPGLYKLSGYEVATRLSYLMWGTTPPPELLDWAEQGVLQTPAQIRDAAFTMVASDRTIGGMDQFHALWLGYSVLPHAADLTARMRTESARLVERTFRDDGSWLDLFTATDTYVDKALAAHYGLPKPAGGASEGWVPYGASGRQGLLSHGSFLSVLSDFSDTSPTRRGKKVRERLLCEEIPAPPDNVNADAPPSGTSSPCKWERYAGHRAKGSTCESCHSHMDPIGFGLENYDREGKYRTHDIDSIDGSPTFGQELSGCTIRGEGDVGDLGTFSGPKELAALLVDSDRLGPCAATQFHRFAIGRAESPDDQPALDEFARRFKSSGYRFQELVLTYVSSNAFGYRRTED